jgi:hypothetical protein
LEPTNRKVSLQLRQSRLNLIHAECAKIFADDPDAAIERVKKIFKTKYRYKYQIVFLLRLNSRRKQFLTDAQLATDIIRQCPMPLRGLGISW